MFDLSMLESRSDGSSHADVLFEVLQGLKRLKCKLVEYRCDRSGFRVRFVAENDAPSLLKVYLQDDDTYTAVFAGDDPETFYSWDLLSGLLSGLNERYTA